MVKNPGWCFLPLSLIPLWKNWKNQKILSTGRCVIFMGISLSGKFFVEEGIICRLTRKAKTRGCHHFYFSQPFDDTLVISCVVIKNNDDSPCDDKFGIILLFFKLLMTKGIQLLAIVRGDIQVDAHKMRLKWNVAYLLKMLLILFIGLQRNILKKMLFKPKNIMNRNRALLPG